MITKEELMPFWEEFAGKEYPEDKGPIVEALAKNYANCNSLNEFHDRLKAWYKDVLVNHHGRFHVAGVDESLYFAFVHSMLISLREKCADEWS